MKTIKTIPQNIIMFIVLLASLVFFKISYIELDFKNTIEIVAFTLAASVLFFFFGRMLIYKGFYFNKIIYRAIFLILLPFIYLMQDGINNFLYIDNVWIIFILYVSFVLGNFSKKIPDNFELIALNTLNYYIAIRDLFATIKTMEEKLLATAVISQRYYYLYDENFAEDVKDLVKESVTDSENENEILCKFIPSLVYLVMSIERYAPNARLKYSSYIVSQDEIDRIIKDEHNDFKKIILRKLNQKPTRFSQKVVLFSVKQNNDIWQGYI
jgi:hypothetical protein